MDHEQMWNEMKDTYISRCKALEAQGKIGTKEWINAKRFVDVMTFFEWNHPTDTKTPIAT